MLERHAVLLEDQPLLRDLLKRHLEQLDFSVSAVETIEEARAALESSGTDLLVVESRANDIDMLSWLESVRLLAPGIPFVVLSGLGARTGPLPHSLAPCTSVKLPVDADQFAEAIRRSLREADDLGGASVAFGFDLEVATTVPALGSVLARSAALQSLVGGLPTRAQHAFAHALRTALRRAREAGPVRVRCALGTSRLSCEVGVTREAAPWSLEDPQFLLVRSVLTSFELSPDGRRLTFAVSRTEVAA